MSEGKGMNLTIEQMREIVDGAPNLTSVVISTYCLFTKSYWDGNGQDCESCVDLSDLRAALADHDRTDYVSDIRNHISPTTVVIER
ncbi:hypothetical protein [Acinetobacter schindleri]|uniref:hypothetical protein n=1 Tax=Acinetobacter schindleri TaxID=108981 RepID=UPI003F56DF95